MFGYRVPPAISTLPPHAQAGLPVGQVSSVAVCLARRFVMGPLMGADVLVAGSNVSAFGTGHGPLLFPPTNSTLPFPRSVAVNCAREPTMISPRNVKVRVAGLYNSADRRFCPTPPTR